MSVPLESSTVPRKSQPMMTPGGLMSLACFQLRRGLSTGLRQQSRCNTTHSVGFKSMATTYA
jgi:hypothetical protein